jgi:hypothetical protein
VASRLGDRTRWIEVEDGVVIFDPDTNTYLDLDERGAELWLTMVDLGWDEEALVRHLVDEFASSPEQAEEVVASFVGELTRRGVLRPRG